MSWAKQTDPSVVLAFRSVFGRHQEDVQTVLAALAAHCRFYMVETGGVPVDELNYTAGLRAAFGPIFEAINLSDEDVVALQAAQAAQGE